MRLVAQNTDAEIAEQRAAEDISWAVRDLAANLIRIVRGAGKPYAVPEQTEALLLALAAYWDAAGAAVPDYRLADALAFGQDRADLSQLTDAEACRMDAKNMIVRGALQVAASRLVGQTTQRVAGDTEMHHGIMELERVRTEARAARATAERVPRRSIAARKPRGKGQKA